MGRCYNSGKLRSTTNQTEQCTTPRLNSSARVQCWWDGGELLADAPGGVTSSPRQLPCRATQLIVS